MNETDEGEDARRTDGRMDGWTSGAEDGRRRPKRAERSRLKSASTPWGVSAPMGNAVVDRATRSRERREIGARGGRWKGREVWEEEMGGREEGEGIYATLTRAKIHVEKHAVRRCADKPRRTLGRSARVLRLFLSRRKEEVEGGGKRERERVLSVSQFCFVEKKLPRN